jgi:hypothetical protein
VTLWVTLAHATEPAAMVAMARGTEGGIRHQGCQTVPGRAC